MEQDLTTDLLVLQSHLDGMLDRVQHNSTMLKRFQEFEMELLRLSSLSEMIEHILDDVQTIFGLDKVTFCLLDERGDIARFLEEDGFTPENREGLILLSDKGPLENVLGIKGRSFLGRYDAASCADFFPGEDKPSSVAVIPLSRRGQCMGSLNLGSRQDDRFLIDMATDFVEHLVSVLGICLENNLNFETMRRTSLIDTLTGVNNRLFLEQRMDEELDRSRRSEQPLTCLFIDIDRFKSINDRFGHLAGDQVLARVADTVKKHLRNNDVLARFGGEEFVALLTNIDQNLAQEIAERVRRSIKSLSIEFKEQIISATVSIGFATFLPDKNQERQTNANIAERLIQKADAALYRAKNNGRDRVESGGLVREKDGLLCKIA